MSMKSEKEERKFYMAMMAQILQHCGGNPLESMGYCMTMMVGILGSMHNGDLHAAADHLERVAVGTANALRDDDDPREFTEKVSVH